jgi:hypothetical protein
LPLYAAPKSETCSLTNTQAGWLAGIVSASYMLAIFPLVSLTDREFARQTYLASSMLNALSCFGVALCDSLLPALRIWGSAGLRQWVVVFLAFCAADRAGVPAQARIMLALCAPISFLGVPAGLLGNELSIRDSLLCPSHSFRPVPGTEIHVAAHPCY